MRIEANWVVIFVLLSHEATAEEWDVPKKTPKEVSWKVDLTSSGEYRNDAGALSAQIDARLDYQSGIHGILLPYLSAEASGFISSDPFTRGSVRLGADSRILDLHVKKGQRRLGMFPIDVRSDLEVNTRPKLSTKRSLWRSNYTRQSFSWTMQSANLLGVTLGDFSLDVSSLRQEESRAPHQNRYDLGIAFFGYHHARETSPDFIVKALAIDGVGVENVGGADAHITKLDFVRLTGLPTGLGLYIDGAIGFSDSSGYQSINGNKIATEDLPIISLPTFSAAIHGSSRVFGGRASIERSMYLTSDIELSIEERATLDFEIHGKNSTTTLGGFASRNKLWSDAKTSSISHTGGGEVSHSRKLTDRINILGSGEVAQSFYTTLDGEKPRPELGFNVKLGAQISLARSGPKERKTPAQKQM